MEELRTPTPSQGPKRKTPSPSPSPKSGFNTSLDSSVEKQDAKKTKTDSEGDNKSRERRVDKATKDFLDKINPIVRVIEIQAGKMMDPHNLSSGKRGSYNRTDRETRFKQDVQREEEQKKRQARRENKTRNGIEPRPGVKEASYAGPLNDHDQFHGKTKDQNYFFGIYGDLLVPDELRIDGIPPKLDEDGRLTAKTSRINEPNNAIAIAHRDRFYRAKVIGQCIGKEFLDDAQKSATTRGEEMIKAGVDENLAKAITNGVLGMLNDSVKPYIIGAAATQESMSDMVTSVDKKVDTLSDDVQNHIEVAATKTDVCRMIQSESDKENTILIKDSKYLDQMQGAYSQYKKKEIALMIVKEMLDLKKADFETRMIEYVKTVFPSHNDRKGPKKKGTIEIHFNPRRIYYCDEITELIRKIPDTVWAGQNKNKELVDRMSLPHRKEYEDNKKEWEDWKAKDIGEILVYKSIKSKYESKQFFEQAETAHRGNMIEVKKTFPEGLQEMRMADEGEFANKFPSFLLAKRYNPHAPGPTIQKLSANSFNEQGEYKKLVMQALMRGEAWNERQGQWSEERMRAKEKRFGTKTKIKDKLEDNSTEEQVEMIFSKSE